MLSTLCQLAPHQMKVRGLAALGLSKDLPASCPSPFICHDAFIGALSHLLAMLWGAGLAPESGFSPLLPRWGVLAALRPS